MTGAVLLAGPAAVDRGGDIPSGEATSAYREFAPPPAWRSAVRCVWEQRISAGVRGYTQRVLPDGHADLLISDGGETMVVGPATEVALPMLPAGSTLRGVRLSLDRLRAVLGVPGSALTDRLVPLSALVSGPVVRAVEDAVTVGDVRACEAVGGWLTRVEPDPKVTAAVQALWQAPGLDVAAVADRVGLSGRQLRRALLAGVGLGPKTFQRIGRLQRFLALARSGAPGGLAELAIDAGYADQPHLSRESKALSGLTPAELLAQQLG